MLPVAKRYQHCHAVVVLMLALACTRTTEKTTVQPADLSLF
jgi:uncharacterized membrane protein YgdD (TMEM256/DUF423 family)